MVSENEFDDLRIRVGRLEKAQEAQDEEVRGMEGQLAEMAATLEALTKTPNRKGLEKVAYILNEREMEAELKYYRNLIKRHNEHIDTARICLKMSAEDGVEGPLDDEDWEIADHLPDLICNLLHLAAANGMNPKDSMESAWRNHEPELAEYSEAITKLTTEARKETKGTNEPPTSGIPLVEVCKRLLEWEAGMGGFEAKVWTDLRKLLRH